MLAGESCSIQRRAKNRVHVIFQILYTVVCDCTSDAAMSEMIIPTYRFQFKVGVYLNRSEI